MKRVLTYLVLLTFSTSICCAQNSLDQSLWYSTMVYDTLSNAYPNQGIERFMFFENENNISTLSIDQKISMSTGETIVSYTIEANNLANVGPKKFKVKEYRVDNFEVINADSIYYRERGYHIGFKRLNVDRSKQTQNSFSEFLLKNRVRIYYENGESVNQLHVYKKDGNKEIEVIDSSSSWESPYRLFSFEGFVFLRGITSYPIILEDIEKTKVTGLEIHNDSNPIKTEIRIE